MRILPPCSTTKRRWLPSAALAKPTGEVNPPMGDVMASVGGSGAFGSCEARVILNLKVRQQRQATHRSAAKTILRLIYSPPLFRRTGRLATEAQRHRGEGWRKFFKFVF